MRVFILVLVSLVLLRNESNTGVKSFCEAFYHLSLQSKNWTPYYFSESELLWKEKKTNFCPLSMAQNGKFEDGQVNVSRKEIRRVYMDWCDNFGKYVEPQDSPRYATFSDNYQKLVAYQAATGKKMALTPYADCTPSEYKDIMSKKSSISANSDAKQTITNGPSKSESLNSASRKMSPLEKIKLREGIPDDASNQRVEFNMPEEINVNESNVDEIMDGIMSDIKLDIEKIAAEAKAAGWNFPLDENRKVVSPLEKAKLREVESRKQNTETITEGNESEEVDEILEQTRIIELEIERMGESLLTLTREVEAFDVETKAEETDLTQELSDLSQPENTIQVEATPKPVQTVKPKPSSALQMPPPKPPQPTLEEQAIAAAKAQAEREAAIAAKARALQEQEAQRLARLRDATLSPPSKTTPSQDEVSSKPGVELKLPKLADFPSIFGTVKSNDDIDEKLSDETSKGQTKSALGLDFTSIFSTKPSKKFTPRPPSDAPPRNVRLGLNTAKKEQDPASFFSFFSKTDTKEPAAPKEEPETTQKSPVNPFAAFFQKKSTPTKSQKQQSFGFTKSNIISDPPSQVKPSEIYRSKTVSLIGGLRSQMLVRPTKSPTSESDIPVLSNFVQNKDGSLTGQVSNSRTFRDGSTITTTPVKSGVKKGDVVRTLAGTIYRLQ